MKRFLLLSGFCMLSALGYSQFYVAATSDLYVKDNYVLYTNDDFENDGTVTLNQDSEFVFDKNFVNDATFFYESGANKGILVIGSGNATSNGAQLISFNPSVTEEAPFIELNKQGGTATINRGLMRLQETLTSFSGTLDANSAIADTPVNNTVTGLTFISNNTNTAVIDESTGGSVQNVLVERYIPGNQRAFRAFSSSVNTNGSIRDNLMEGGQVLAANVNTINDPRPGFGTHITGGGISTSPNPTASETAGFDVTITTNPSMYEYTDPDGDSYTSIPNTGVTMSAGNSYFMMIRGDRSFALNANNIVGPQTVLRTIGDAQIGGFNASTASTMPTVASTLTDQYYASIGNPYQAQVNIAELLSSPLTTGIDKTQVYVYNPASGVGQGAWLLLNFQLNAGVYDFVSSVPNLPGAEFLQPNQALYVEKDQTTNPVEVRFEESFKRNTNPTATVDIFSEPYVVTDLNVRLEMTEISNNDLRDGVLIQFSDSFADNFIQEEDAISFSNFLETMSTVSEDGQLLSFDKRNINADGEIVQINIQNFMETNYKFQISVENNDAQEDIYLIDNYLNTQTLIDVDTMEYNFSVDQSIPGSINPNRFQLGINTTTLSSNNFELNGLSLYPNPVVDIVSVNLAEFTGEVETVNIFDVTGKIVGSKSITGNENILDLDMTSLSSGVYIIQLDTNTGKYQQKLIKQ